MVTRNNRLVPVRAIHPGEILQEELRERGINKNAFALMIGVPTAQLNEFLAGKRNLNEEWAMMLEKHLGIPCKTWVQLHNGYMQDCMALEERKSKKRLEAIV